MSPPVEKEVGWLNFVEWYPYRMSNIEEVDEDT